MAALNLPDILKSMLSEIPPLIWILAGVLFAASIARSLFGARIKGWLGEQAVARALRGLNADYYTCFHDLYLPRPDGKGTTQLDHVVVSTCGIFVIETKNYKGWIYGSEKQKQWTQTIYKRKHRFQNPLHQNALHVRALAKFLALERDQLRSIVYFVGDSTFKTELPDNVLDGGLRNHIEQFQTPVLLPPDLERFRAMLHELNQPATRKNSIRDHRETIKSRS